MLRLDLKLEPHWLDLGHGVRVQVRPCSSALVMAAQAEAATVEDDASPRSLVLLKALARLAVIAWEGVGDAEGRPAELTPEAIDALLDLWPLADAFERDYLGPALLLEQEKNG